jgi:hypothetical protein
MSMECSRSPHAGAREYGWHRIAFSLLLAVSTVRPASAQESFQQRYDVPIVLTRIVTYRTLSSRPDDSVPNATYSERFHDYDYDDQEDFVRDFGPDNFQLRVGGMPARLQGLSIDKGPKRIVLTLDASKPISKKDWESELWDAKRLLEFARSIDTFGFVLVGGDAATHGFISPGEAQKYLRRLGTARPATRDAEAKIYDALLTAAKSLDPPQFGDVIIFFGRGEDSGSKTAVTDLRQMFLKQRLRFYGLTFPGQKRNAAGWPIPDPGLESLSEATGYSIWMTNAKVLRQVDFDSWYRCIAEPYRFSITAAMSDQASLAITLLPGLKKKKLDKVTIRYPQFLVP